MSTHRQLGGSAWDRSIQRYLRLTAARGRETERIGPFLATFDVHDPMTHLNYAIPDDGATPTAADVAALIAAYDQRGRVPRLEYLPSVAPRVQAVLAARGFVVDGRFAGMTCLPNEAEHVAPPPHVAILPIHADDELRRLRAAQLTAFGLGDIAAEQIDADDVISQQNRIRAGEIVLAAIADGVVVGGGVATAPIDCVTEIAGIAVVERHRRNGIATALTSALTREAFARGCTLAWLTPGDNEAQRVYRRAGYAERTTVIHMSSPRPDR